MDSHGLCDSVLAHPWCLWPPVPAPKRKKKTKGWTQENLRRHHTAKPGCNRSGKECGPYPYVIYLHVQPVNQYDVLDPFSQPSYRSIRCGAGSPVAAQTQMHARI